MDLRTILSLLPYALTLAAGVVGGWAGASYKFERFDRPAIVSDTQKADAEAYEHAARDAQRDAELAKYHALEALTQRMLEQKASDDARQQQQLDRLNQENANYAQQLAADGRSCPLTQSDIDFLNGVRAQP